MEGFKNQISNNLNLQSPEQDIQKDYKQILKSNPNLDEIVKNK
jgi:hypothetical protein